MGINSEGSPSGCGGSVNISAREVSIFYDLIKNPSPSKSKVLMRQGKIIGYTSSIP